MAFSHALPVDLLQSLFALLDPWGVADKYRGFARLRRTASAPVCSWPLEDWLNDGVPLAAEVARTCLGEWYGEKRPPAASGASPACRSIPPPSRRRPSSRCPDATESCRPNRPGRWLDLIPGAVLHQPAAGHIGMAAGARAEASLWRPMLDWLQATVLPEPMPLHRA